MRPARPFFSSTFAFAFALVFAAPASSDSSSPPPPPDTPSIGQYVETVPTAQGGSAAGAGTTTNSRLLTRDGARALSAQPPSVAKRLRAVATSAAYGAPQQALETTPGAATVASEHSNSGVRRAFSAAISAAGDSGDDHVFWLLASLIVVTSAMVWTVRQRR